MSSGKYKILNILGKGSYGTVFEALDTVSGAHVALKEVMNEDGIENLLEIDIMSRAKHPNIMYALDISFSKFMSKIIMPLGTPLKKATVYNEKNLIRDLISGVVYLHRHNIYHCDIKADNMIIMDETLVISDFGVSVGAPSKRLCQQSLHYSPPEFLYHFKFKRRPIFPKEHLVFYDQVEDSISSDYWATGVCIIYILSQREAFSRNGHINEEIVPDIMNSYLEKPSVFLKKFMDDFWIEGVYNLMDPIVSRRSIQKIMSLIPPLNEGTFEEIRRDPIKHISEDLFNKISEWLFLISDKISLDTRFYIVSLDLFLRYYTKYPGVIEKLLIDVGITSLFVIQKIFATAYYSPKLYALEVLKAIKLSISRDIIEETEISIIYVLNNRIVPYDLLNLLESEEIKNPILLGEFISKYFVYLK